jgi:hypothetical protein
MRELWPDATIVGVDILARNKPDVLADIRAWEPPYAAGEVDVMWCSPPCQHFSIARQGPRDLALGDSVAARCFELIERLAPARWVVENPASGMMHWRPFAARWEPCRHVTTYCKYGFLSKPTSIWTNAPVTLPMCRAGDRCPAFALGAHPVTAQKGLSRNKHAPDSLGMVTTAALWRVPAGLVKALVV